MHEKLQLVVFYPLPEICGHLIVFELIRSDIKYLETHLFCKAQSLTPKRLVLLFPGQATDAICPGRYLSVKLFGLLHTVPAEKVEHPFRHVIIEVHVGISQEIKYYFPFAGIRGCWKYPVLFGLFSDLPVMYVFTYPAGNRPQKARLFP